MLALAAEHGVRLSTETTLFAVFTLEVEPRIVSQYTLPAGTIAQLLGSLQDAIISPLDPSVSLLEVRVLDPSLASGGYRVGWVDRTALEQAEALSPLARGREGGANVRAGDDESFGIRGYLRGGESAEILGQSSRLTGWLYVRLESGTRGWVVPWAVDVLGDISELRYIEPPPLIIPTEPPSATPVPLQPGQPAPPSGSESGETSTETEPSGPSATRPWSGGNPTPEDTPEPPPPDDSPEPPPGDPSSGGNSD
jgi:hypothetical protein